MYAAAFAFEIANFAGMIATVKDATPVPVRLGPITVEHLRI
jgi:hypothetical protein